MSAPAALPAAPPLPEPPPGTAAQGGAADTPEVSAAETAKWGEMVDGGLSAYWRAHPDRFRRRVRRGIPPQFRWQVWKAAVRLEEKRAKLPMALYEELARRPNSWTSAIDIDIARTFPDLKTFDKVQQQRLMRILNAFAGHSQTAHARGQPAVGYCQGMNFVAGLLLLVSDSEEESFGVLCCLMEGSTEDNRAGLNGFYMERLPLLRRYLEACDYLVKDAVPELRDHFIKENVQPAVYLHQWFLTLFINCFPHSMVLIIWDVIICEGLPVVLRIAVSILQVLKDTLLSMHFEDIIKFFKMMKTYDDGDGELNAFRIGQLLMKHTEHVVIPDRVLEFINRDPSGDDDAALDADEAPSADPNAVTIWQSFSRMFTFHGERGGETPGKRTQD